MMCLVAPNIAMVQSPLGCGLCGHTSHPCWLHHMHRIETPFATVGLCGTSGAQATVGLSLTQTTPALSLVHPRWCVLLCTNPYCPTLPGPHIQCSRPPPRRGMPYLPCLHHATLALDLLSCLGPCLRPLCYEECMCEWALGLGARRHLRDGTLGPHSASWSAPRGRARRVVARHRAGACVKGEHAWHTGMAQAGRGHAMYSGMP